MFLISTTCCNQKEGGEVGVGVGADLAMHLKQSGKLSLAAVLVNVTWDFSGILGLLGGSRAAGPKGTLT